jgi:DNA-binding LacI/PurR family transcriptional regulator
MQTLVVDKSNNAPAKRQLQEYIKDGIKNNRYRPGDRLPTTLEFVNAAGVSSNTVRQAMAELIREGILKAVPGMGTFVVDRVQQEIENGSNIKKIAILPLFHQTSLNITNDSFRAESVRGFLEECERSGVIGSILPGELIRKEPEKVKLTLDAFNCQGVVWLYPEPHEWDIIDHLSDSGLPIVVTRRSNIDSDVAFVGADYEKAGFDCCRRFIQSGCDKMVLFNHFAQPKYIESQRYCGWPIGIKQGLSRAFEVMTGHSEGKIEQHYVEGFTEKQTRIIIDALEGLQKDEGILFTNTYHLYNILVAEPEKTRSILKNRKVGVVGNKNFLVHLLPFVEGIDLDVLVDPFKEIAQCAAQKLVALIDGYFARTTTLVNIEIKKMDELELYKYTK